MTIILAGRKDTATLPHLKVQMQKTNDLNETIKINLKKMGSGI